LVTFVHSVPRKPKASHLASKALNAQTNLFNLSGKRDDSFFPALHPGVLGLEALNGPTDSQLARYLLFEEERPFAFSMGCSMRLFYFLVLLAIVAILAIFAFQNDETVSLRFFNRSIASPMSLLIGCVYLLGMLSGWTVVGFLKRSLQRVTDRPESR
jgi:putative membrane protein